MKKLFLLALIAAISNLCFGQNISLPITFDLRDVNGKNFISSIKSQQGGTCWTHGTMSAIESNLLISGEWRNNEEKGEPNLSEYHLDWWNGFNDFNNEDIEKQGDGIIIHNGGDYLISAAYLSRGGGAVRDIDGQSFDKPPLKSTQNFHHYYPRNIEWHKVGKNLENINNIKKTIIDNGAMGTCIDVDNWLVDGIHYQPSTDNQDPNHSIAIIGWNDTLTTQAPLPGAWLAKNSWGTDFGSSNDGCFWISFYDKHCGQHPEMGAVSFKDVELFKYNNVYYHDYHGWRDTKTNIYEAFNAFNAQGDELLKSVSFYTTEDSVNYSIIIYNAFINNALSNQICTKSGFIEHKGFHTIDLNSVAQITSGNKFYIYLKVSDGGLAFDRTSTVSLLLGAKNETLVESSAKTGESFYSENNKWNDFNTIEPTGNFCIKGLTIAPKNYPTKASIPEGPSTICKNNVNTSYQTYSKNANSYQWSLHPDSAGILFTHDSIVEIDWSDKYTGTVKLTVKGINEVGEGVAETARITSRSVQAPAKILLANDTLVCNGAQLDLFEHNLWYCTYRWSNEKEFKKSPSLFADSAGSYYVYQLDTIYGCIGRSDTINVDVYPKPWILSTTDTSIAYEDSITILFNPFYFNVMWNDSSTTYSKTIKGSELGSGEHTFLVSVEDGNMCSYSELVSISVKFPLDIKDLNSKKCFELFPNPSKGTVNIKINNNSQKIFFKLYDVSGKLLFGKAINNIEKNSTTNFKLPKIQKGLYYYKISSENNNYNGKLLIIV
ncbi:MAG: T9SS type A sorting domain-containing protein [Bacteroidetes bacterium]|nr:T9SS type A sorting domain-containing protein [Bacteroidota bacterium]